MKREDSPETTIDDAFVNAVEKSWKRRKIKFVPGVRIQDVEIPADEGLRMIRQRTAIGRRVIYEQLRNLYEKGYKHGRGIICKYA